MVADGARIPRLGVPGAARPQLRPRGGRRRGNAAGAGRGEEQPHAVPAGELRGLPSVGQLHQRLQIVDLELPGHVGSSQSELPGRTQGLGDRAGRAHLEGRTSLPRRGHGRSVPELDREGTVRKQPLDLPAKRRRSRECHPRLLRTAGGGRAILPCRFTADSGLPQFQVRHSGAPPAGGAVRPLTPRIEAHVHRAASGSRHGSALHRDSTFADLDADVARGRQPAGSTLLGPRQPLPRLYGTGDDNEQGVRVRRRYCAQLARAVRATGPEFSHQMPPLELELARRFREPAHGAGPTQLAPIEPISTSAGLGMDAGEVTVQASHGIGQGPKPEQLRVTVIAPGRSLKHRPGEQRLAPEGDQPLHVEILGVNRPQSHVGEVPGRWHAPESERRAGGTPRFTCLDSVTGIAPHQPTRWQRVHKPPRMRSTMSPAGGPPTIPGPGPGSRRRRPRSRRAAATAPWRTAAARSGSFARQESTRSSRAAGIGRSVRADGGVGGVWACWSSSPIGVSAVKTNCPVRSQ